MASGTSGLIVRLSLDTPRFEGSLSRFEGQMTKLQTSAQTLTDKLAAHKQKEADLEASYEKSKAETGENPEETKNLDAREQAGWSDPGGHAKRFRQRLLPAGAEGEPSCSRSSRGVTYPYGPWLSASCSCRQGLP